MFWKRMPDVILCVENPHPLAEPQTADLPPSLVATLNTNRQTEYLARSFKRDGRRWAIHGGDLLLLTPAGTVIGHYAINAWRFV